MTKSSFDFPVKTPRRFLQQLFALSLVVGLLSLPPASVAREREFTGPRKLNQRIESIVRQNEAYRGFWGIEVVRLSDGRVLYSRGEKHLFLPASNMKLFTTAAAMEKLGPDFIYRTTVESEAVPDSQGRVGDLFLVGRGDPNLSGRALPYQEKTQSQGPADAALQKLADQLVAKGVREVTGNLIADDSYFLFEPYSHGWAEEDLQWGYGAPATALAFNDNALTLHVQPGPAAGSPARVWLEPVQDYYKLVSHLDTVGEPGETRIFFDRAPGSMELDVWGQIPVGVGGEEDRVAIVDPPHLVGELFRRALESRGIALQGQIEVRHATPFEAAALSGSQPGTPPQDPQVLAEYDSLPLRESIKVINKVSQNLHAEMLLRTLGRQGNDYGSLTRGLAALQAFTHEVGIDPGAVYFTDGSGLSRKTLVAPAAVVKLLEHMASSQRFEPFFDSLPVAGSDGTLADRFKGTPAEGRIHAKTGTIEHVNSLSGYMDLSSGRRLAFSLFGNSYTFNSKQGAAALDRLALAIYTWFASHR